MFVFFQDDHLSINRMATSLAITWHIRKHLRFIAMKRLLICFYLFVITLLINVSHLQAQKATNPIVFADVPDLSMIRVGDTYYMSSTTMHMSPGVPIMKSKDLVNWKIVSYAYDTLVSNDEMNLVNGKSTYGRGSWASSLRYHKGSFYVSTFAATSGKTHIYSTRNIEKGPWKEITFRPPYHDHSLFFDDDGKVFLIYGNKKLTLLQLKEDLSGVKEGGINQTIIEDATQPSQNVDSSSLGEGSQLFKIAGKYYLFNITWPRGGMRTVVIHRADKITGPWEGRVALQDLGVAQGGLIDEPNGRWFAYLFRDFGAVGRIPYLVPVRWEEGWPVLGVDGKVPDTLDLPGSKSLIPGLVAPDEFTRKKGERALPLVWQWNHNPDNTLWSVNKRKGFLRLTTGRIDSSFLLARNTLTQRTIGPVCTGSTSLDVSNMKDGDFAGLCLLQKNYGLVGVRAESGGKFLVMINATDGKPVAAQVVPLHQNSVYFKAECDFTNMKDVAHFYYSLDGKTWTLIGTPLKMAYTLPHFMGYRFGLFNYAAKEAGGFVDFDYFRISDRISQKE
jgi:beta-xylosidase